MVFRQLFFFFIFFFPGVAPAQHPPSFYVRQYGTEDGLPSNGIKGLQWDRKSGFLWIATEAGIVRFNGMSFKTYSSEDNPRITNERILFLVRNNAGTIYTADNTGNIFFVKKNTLSFFRNNNITGNSKTNIFSIVVSDWLFNANHAIRNGPFALQFLRVAPVSDSSCFLLQAGQLYYFSLSMEQPVVVQQPGDGAAALFKCGDDTFIIDRNNQAWHFDKEHTSFTRTGFIFPGGTEKPDIQNNPLLWENGMDAPIYFSGGRAWRINWREGRLMASIICEKVPTDVLIRYAQYDEYGKTLFLGTDSKGIIVIRQNRVNPVRKERASAKERSSYYSQLELPDGNVLTNEGHVLGREVPPMLLPPFKGPFSNSTFMMGDSVFWFVKANPAIKTSCLHSYNIRTKKLTVYSKIKGNYSQVVMAHSLGSLYLANERGISRLKDDSIETVYTYPLPDNRRTHFDMKETEPGVLAIANCNALLRFTISSRKLDTLYLTTNYCVRTIWVYKDYVFFGTYGHGFFISKKGKVKAMPLDKNKYLLFSHCFVDDGSGYCWISTNRGLFKANITEMIYAYETGAAQVYYHYFGKNDGMDMTEMNGGCTPCGLILKNKTISFPTMEGLLWVNPRNAIPVLPDGEIFIDEVMVDNKRTDLTALESEPLIATNHDIQIRVGFSAWCNKENIYLQYQLNEGTAWKTVNTDNGAVIQFGNLKRGRYLLRIRKLNGFGINNYSFNEFRFSIPTPWYQRWWFYLHAGLFAWGGLVLYFRFRTGQLKQRQRKLELQVAEKTKELLEQNEILEKNNSIKTRLISIISHDIVTPLKFVTVAGNKLLEKRTMMPEELQQETIREMTNTTQELQMLSTNILNWIKYQNENRRMVKETFNLHEMVEQVFGILRSLAKQKSLLIRNGVDTGILLYQYYEPLKILIYNLLTNAIHFTENGMIEVMATKENGYVSITVKDEGVGMTAEQIQRLMADEVVITSANVDNKRGHGLGYLIIKDLVKTMGAALTIQSNKDTGTMVTVKMPAV